MRLRREVHQEPCGVLLTGRSEYLEGRILVQWLKRKNLLFSHLAQSTFTRSFRTLSKLKASGVVKGVPDYVVIVPGRVLFVELKRIKGGRVSKEQKEWVEALTEAGCPAKVCLGAAEAIKFVEGFLNGR